MLLTKNIPPFLVCQLENINFQLNNHQGILINNVIKIHK